MTACSEIIFQAFRESNLISLAATPTTAQSVEALARLNSLVANVQGFEVGEKLSPWFVGLEGIDGPLDLQAIVGWQQPVWQYPFLNSRLYLNNAEAQPIYFPLNAQDGSRMATRLVNADLTTAPVTLHGNGYLIEGADTVTLALNDDTVNRSWLFRADLGNWTKDAPLVAADPLPYPAFADDYFITRLAMRLNPRYGRAADPQTIATQQRAEEQLKAHYAQIIVTAADPAVLALSVQVYNTWLAGGRAWGAYGWQPGGYGWMG